MSFLDLKDRVFLVMGVANRKSVAYLVGRTLEEEGAKVVYSVRSPERRDSLAKLLEGRPVRVCDVERPEELEALAQGVGSEFGPLDGFVHSIAFANYSDGFKPFHETRRDDYLQAIAVSSFSFVEAARALKPFLKPRASVVAISISSVEVTAENYGYMAPIKASLEASARYLAKSFSKDSEIRFNTVNPGTLKTRSSAGIPGYLESYLYSEMLTFRKRGLETQEVANAVAFLLSPRSSGINGTGLKIDAGMGLNYFDEEVARRALRRDPS